MCLSLHIYLSLSPPLNLCVLSKLVFLGNSLPVTARKPRQPVCRDTLQYVREHHGTISITHLDCAFGLIIQVPFLGELRENKVSYVCWGGGYASPRMCRCTVLHDQAEILVAKGNVIMLKLKNTEKEDTRKTDSIVWYKKHAYEYI